jgi:glutaminyl-tRNA synthetase
MRKPSGKGRNPVKFPFPGAWSALLLGMASDETSSPHRLDFIREIVRDDLASGKHATTITRFPPEPNGYLHIGHAKSICLNFGLAVENASSGARCHLRFDDTNPTKEEQEYVDSIQEDVRWLGFDWGEHLYFASDYFAWFEGCARHLIANGLAYVDEQSAEEIRATRGTLTEPGSPSPWRDRPVEESLDIFSKMKAGEIGEGAAVLRARIDMASANLNLRDPVLYRVIHAGHHHAGDSWKMYPMYDFAHPLEDAFEDITHSLCTLEFEDHRPLYDWVIENCQPAIARIRGHECRPRQIEFARLNLTYTVMSKRKLLKLVQENHVSGWDDPRMPTISGLRRRGVPPEAIRQFCRVIGMTKTTSLSDIALLEHAVREVLNKSAPRYMAVLDPIRVELTNWDENRVESLVAALNPEDPEAGERAMPFGRELFIERDDFMENPPKGYFRLSPGGEVRLRHAWIIRCDEVIKDETGRVTGLRCSVDHDTLGKNPEGRKVRGVIHWVSAAHAVACEVRLYDRLFQVEEPDAMPGEFTNYLNPSSLALQTAMVEPALAAVAVPETRVQFERIGYFCADRIDSSPQKPVFNRTLTLRDSWAKAVGK